MDSRQLSKTYKGLSEWQPFNEESVKSALKQYGTYILRMAQGKCFGRLKGESDILYIGSTEEGKRGLRGRLQQYLRPGPTQLTNKRIDEMAKKYDMEIAWCLCREGREASNLEFKLLHQYLDDHDELPPLNHAGKRLQKKLLEGNLGLIGTLTLKHTDKDGNPIKRIEG